MITDHIKNRALYTGVSDGIRQGLEAIASGQYDSAEPGRYELPNGLYLLVQHYGPKKLEEAVWEAHRNYLDIQYVVSGDEYIGWAPLADMQTKIEYDPAKDMHRLTGQGSLVAIPQGYFMILHPDDAHLPCIEYKAREIVKLVVKVPV